VKSSPGKKIVFTFGRFQPPTRGHELLANKVKEIAGSAAEAVIYVSPSEDNDRNPLPLKDKLSYMKKLFRGVKVKGLKKLKNPFYVAKFLSDEGYKDVVLVVGSDRVAEIKKSMSKYVNHSDPKKAFYFENFNVISAGQRDPDETGVAGISATKMRVLAVKNDFKNFFAASPSGAKEKDAKNIFKLIQKRLKISEIWDTIDQILPENASKSVFNGEIFKHLPESLLKEFNLK